LATLPNKKKKIKRIKEGVAAGFVKAGYGKPRHDHQDALSYIEKRQKRARISLRRAATSRQPKK
jgi:hypothetical protein